MQIIPHDIAGTLVFSRASRSAERDLSSQDAVCLYVCVWKFFFRPTLLQAGLTDLDEIWHDGRSKGVASPKNFWWTLAHFF